MDKEIRREAWKQYLRYFRFWFIITGIVVLSTIGVIAAKWFSNQCPRGNSSAPAERVYDYADVLTDAEEEDLRACIARCEKKSHIDIIIVTLNQEMGGDDWTWETNMMNFSDDFYDNAKYGWNKEYGDGALLLDNWYEDENGSQKGAWLSTSGKMEDIIGAWEEGKVFDAMDVHIGTDPYKAYRAAVLKLAGYGGDEETDVETSSIFCSFLFPVIAALIYAFVNLSQAKAKDTTVPATYVVNGRPLLRSKSDDFIRKNVVSHRIESSSGGSSGGSHRGGGSHGSHRSSSGHSHGGGGRRR